MKTRIKAIKFFPLFNQKWTVADNRLENQRAKNKKIVYNKVKGFQEAIDNFKVEIDPVQISKKARKEQVEKEKLEQIRIDKESAKKEIADKLRKFRRSYSNLMILHQMSQNKQLYSKEIASIKTANEFERKTSYYNNDSAIILTTRLHNSSSMKITTRDKTTSRLSVPKFPFNIKNSNNSKRKITKCTQSTNCDIECDVSRTNNNNNTIAISRNKKHICNSNNQLNKHSILALRNDKAIKNEINVLFKSYTIENPFKRTISHQPKYNNIKGKVRNDLKQNQSQIKLCHSDTNLLRVVIKSKDIENAAQRISWTINSQRENITFIPKSDLEQKTKRKKTTRTLKKKKPMA